MPGGKVFPEDQFVDLVPFPVEFENPDDALTEYNALGIWHKVQFKVLSISKRPDTGITAGFSLCCAKRGNCRTPQNSALKVNQGLVLKDTGEVPCPVVIRFRWN